MTILSTIVLICGIFASLMGLAYGVSALDSYNKARKDLFRDTLMWPVAKAFTKISVYCLVAAAIFFFIYFLAF